jgi:hypothetical protein
VGIRQIRAVEPLNDLVTTGSHHAGRWRRWDTAVAVLLLILVATAATGSWLFVRDQSKLDRLARLDSQVTELVRTVSKISHALAGLTSASGDLSVLQGQVSDLESRVGSLESTIGSSSVPDSDVTAAIATLDNEAACVGQNLDHLSLGAANTIVHDCDQYSPAFP